jgi:hypothetical protein
LSETSVSEIIKKNILKHFITKFLKNISKFKFYIKKIKYHCPDVNLLEDGI